MRMPRLMLTRRAPLTLRTLTKLRLNLRKLLMQLLKNCESQETHTNRKQVKDEKMILSISKIVKIKMVTLTCDRIKKN